MNDTTNAAKSFLILMGLDFVYRTEEKEF
jgi:hypothetical protein